MSGGRPLSPMERAFWLLDRAVSFNGVNVARFRGPIRAEHIRAALDEVQRRHALLRVAVRETPPAFVDVEGPIPLRLAARPSPEAWRDVEQDEINRRYGAGELLCRAVWLEGEGVGELVISHQHVIADAQSAVLMMREIAHALGRVLAGGPPSGAAEVPLRAPLPSLLRGKVGAWERLVAMNAFFFRHVFTKGVRRPRKLALDRLAEFAERRLGVVHVELDERETAALAERARAEGTTMQGAIGAALLIASAGTLALAEGAPRWLGCFSAVSLRDRVGVADEMGLYVSQVTTYHRLAPPYEPARWPLAREIKHDLGRTLARGEQLVTIPMIGMFIPRGADPAPGFARRFDLASPATIGLSNIGRIDLPAEVGPIALEWFHLAVGPSVVAPLVACASTLRGRLSLALVHVEPLFTAARARAFADDTRRWLGATGALPAAVVVENDRPPAVEVRA